MSFESVMPFNHLILCLPLLLSPSIFHSISVFSSEFFFVSLSQSIGLSASSSVLPMNIQDWSPLGFIGLILLLSKGLSRISSAPQLESIDSSVLSLLYGPILTSVHDYWENHSFDYVLGRKWEINISRKTFPSAHQTFSLLPQHIVHFLILWHWLGSGSALFIHVSSACLFPKSGDSTEQGPAFQSMDEYWAHSRYSATWLNEWLNERSEFRPLPFPKS